MKLTSKEFNLLNKISADTKMDCWFSLTTDEDENDWVFDLENGEKISLFQGVEQLIDGMTEEDEERLSVEEIEILNNLTKRLNRKYFFDMDGVIAEYRRDVDSEARMMTQRGYFQNLKPEWNIIFCIKKMLEEGNDVYVLTKVYNTVFTYSIKEKKEWIKKFMPFLPFDHLVFVNGETEQKSEVIEKKFGQKIDDAYFLIDDYTVNLDEWQKNGGTSIKYVNGLNDSKHTFEGERISYTLWADDLADEITK